MERPTLQKADNAAVTMVMVVWRGSEENLDVEVEDGRVDVW